MLFFQPVSAQAFVHPTSFSGIYSEDDYLSDMAQRAAQDYALRVAHARVQAFERQRDHYHPHHHQHHPGGLHSGRFAPASLNNFYGIGPSCARSAFSSPNRRPVVHSPEELAYTAWREEGRERALNHPLEAIVRQRELAREREVQRRRVLAEAAAREQQARAAHTARIEARQAREQEVLFALLGQLGLAIAPAHPVPVAPQVNGQQSPVPFIHPVPPAASVPPPPQNPIDRKGKSKAVDVPVEVTASISNTTPVPAKVPTLKEELQARILSETDPEVQESLVLLFSDLFDAREPAQFVAGPSGHKHVSFQIPVSSLSSSTSASPVPVKAEEKIDTTASSIHTEKPKTDTTKAEEHDGARLHRSPALPPAIAAKLLKFYRARRARRLSLAQIEDVEDALRKLEGALEFPAHLDFIDHSPSPSPADSESDADSALAYTANNTPVHAYEHTLNDLLTRLDAVESNGDLEVRGRRKEVVKEVERALEAMERRIEVNRERARRGSVSSQASDASATVTPYNVHGFDNVVSAVAAEEAPVEVMNEAVEAPVEVEDPEPDSIAEDASAIAEEASLQGEVSEHVPAATNNKPEATFASLPVDNAEPESPPLAVGIPHSGADFYAPSPFHESIYSDPSSPTDDVEDLVPTFDVSSPPGNGAAPQLVSSAVEEAAVPSRDYDADVAGSAAQSEAVTADMTALVPQPQSAPEAVEDAINTSFSPSPAAAAPGATTDATFVTAEANSVLPSTADDASFFTAGAANLPEPEPTPSLTPSGSDSASPTGEETFLLSPTPLTDDQPRQRRPPTSTGDDEVEIIGEDELEAARNGSDWSDVGSESL